MNTNPIFTIILIIVIILLLVLVIILGRKLYKNRPNQK